MSIRILAIDKLPAMLGHGLELGVVLSYRAKIHINYNVTWLHSFVLLFNTQNM